MIGMFHFISFTIHLCPAAGNARSGREGRLKADAETVISGGCRGDVRQGLWHARIPIATQRRNGGIKTVMPLASLMVTIEFQGMLENPSVTSLRPDVVIGGAAIVIDSH